MFYGASVWDPWLVVAQIVCLQCLYYLTLGIFLSIIVGTRLSRMSLVYFFDYAAVTTSTITGGCVIVSFLLSSLAGSVYLLYLIKRSKKCLDFSATLFIIHLFICIVYGGWPASITWWIVNGTGIAAMTLLSEHLCMNRELQDIPTRQSVCVGLGDSHHLAIPEALLCNEQNAVKKVKAKKKTKSTSTRKTKAIKARSVNKLALKMFEQVLGMMETHGINKNQDRMESAARAPGEMT